MLVVSGERMNLLARGTVTSSSADSDWPLTSLYNYRPASEFRFNAAAADDYVELDSNVVSNGGFETSTLSGWTDGSVGASNAISEEGSIVDGGAKAMKLTLTTSGSSNHTTGYQDIEARAGERWNFSAALRGDGTVSARLRIYIVEAGRWLSSDLTTWASTAQDVDTVSAASYATHTGTFTLPSMATLQRATVTLRVSIVAAEASGSGAAYADDVYFWPSWDFVSVHGHNLAIPGITVQLRESTDAFSGSDDLVASPTVYRPTFHHHESTPCDYRYMRVKFVGTNHEAIRLGEIVVGQALESATYPDNGYTRGFVWPGNRMTTPGNVRWARALGDALQRTYLLRFAFRSSANMREFRDEIVARSKGGLLPMVVVPDSTLTESTAVFGWIDSGSWEVQQAVNTTWTAPDFAVVEDGLSVQTS